MDEAEFHKRATSYIKNPDEDPRISSKIEEFKSRSSYVSGGYEDDPSFENLENHLKSIESAYKSKGCNRVFYLALPPSVFVPVAEHVRKHNYASGVNRIIVEKPFGKDFDSSRALIDALNNHWTEDETYRIDHYLGKEMVKNILILRFANVAFSAAWDKNSISNVQITFKEPFGTEGRGGYFNEFGIIRDILQNRALDRVVELLPKF
jgi:glucose-6-phosphate 1-dehydrogenase